MILTHCLSNASENTYRRTFFSGLDIEPKLENTDKIVKLPGLVVRVLTKRNFQNAVLHRSRLWDLIHKKPGLSEVIVRVALPLKVKILKMVNTLNTPKKLWFQCNYVETCYKLNYQQRQSTDCDAMKIAEYGELVASRPNNYK